MKISMTFCSCLLLVGYAGFVSAAPADEYEKQLLEEAGSTVIKGEKAQNTEVEPAVAPDPGTDIKSLSATIAGSLEKALEENRDIAEIRQEMGDVVSGALGQGMNLDEIRDAVSSAMENVEAENAADSKTLESAGKALEEVIEVNRKLIGEPIGDVAADLKQDIKDIVAASNTETPSEAGDDKPEKAEAVSGGEDVVQVAGERLHTVRKGESLSLIARQYYKDGLKYWKIYRANQELLSNPDIILVGQALKIPE